VHLLALAPRGEERVAATLLEAAQRALAGGAPESAVRLLERAQRAQRVPHRPERVAAPARDQRALRGPLGA